MKSKFSIFLISADWRNIFKHDQRELIEKLERDQLEPEVHTFFFLSWSKQWYHAHKGSFETLHLPLMFKVLKPVADLLLWIVGPLTLWWYKVTPDVIVVYDFGSVPAARMMANLWDAKLIMYVNNMPQLYSRTRRFGLIKSWYSAVLERLWKGLPDAYGTINETMRNYLRNLGIPNDIIFQYRVDTIVRDEEHIARAQKGLIRNKLGIPDNGTMVLTVGRLEAEKNHHRMLRYIAHTPKNTHLVILGQGSLREELQQLAQTLGIEQRVHFEGFVQREHIWNYYTDADVFVLLSRAEALGIVFWEAMRVHVPVIGSDLPGIVESLGEHNERGLIVPDDASAETFAGILQEALSSSAEQQKRIADAYDFVMEQNQQGMTIRDIVRTI